jgi:hypothetical protein
MGSGEDELMTTIVEIWIQAFIDRQPIVYRALSHLRPDLLMIAEAQSRETKLECIRLMENYRDVPSTGIWIDSEGENWDYFVHGLGCRLISLVDGEPLEWDAPDVNSFEDEWFLNWAAWRIKHTEPSSGIDIEVIKLDMKKLIEQDIIKQCKNIGGPKFQLSHGR